MPLTQEQRTQRLNYIGGSDAAAVLGMSRYKTPLALWSEKTGAISPRNNDGSLPVILGEKLEEVVADLFCLKTGNKVRRVNDVQVHPKYPFICAQIDRRIVGTDEILEAKTASAFKAGEWEGEDVPSEYILQGLHQLMVTGAERCWIACLIGGNVDFVYKSIERDEDMISELESKEVEFWNEYIIPKRMPRVTAHDQSVLSALFPNGREDVDPIQLPEHFDAIVERIKEIGSEKAGLLGKLMEEKDALQNELRLALGEHTDGMVGNFLVSWRNQTRVSIDSKRLSAEAPEVFAQYSKPSSFRVLRTTDVTKRKK